MFFLRRPLENTVLKPHGVTFPHPVSEGPFSLRTNLHEFVASTRTASQLSMKRKGPDDDGAARLLLHLSDGGDAPQHSATTMASDKAGFEDFDLAPRTERLAKDLEVSLTRNEEVKAGRLLVGLRGLSTNLQHPSMETGLITQNLLLPAECERLAAYLRDPKNRGSKGELMINGRLFSGYDSYFRVHGSFNPALQVLQTTLPMKWQYTSYR